MEYVTLIINTIGLVSSSAVETYVNAICYSKKGRKINMIGKGIRKSTINQNK